MNVWLIALIVIICAGAYGLIPVGLLRLLDPFFKRCFSDEWFEEWSLGPDLPGPFLLWPIFIPIMVTCGTITLIWHRNKRYQVFHEEKEGK